MISFCHINTVWFAVSLFLCVGITNAFEDPLSRSTGDSVLSTSQLSALEAVLTSTIDLERSSLDVPKTLIEADLNNELGLLKRVLVTHADIDLEADVLTIAFRLASAREGETFISSEATVSVSADNAGEPEIVSSGEIGGKADPLGLANDKIKGLEAAKKMLQSMGFDPQNYSGSRYATLPIKSMPKGAKVVVKEGANVRSEDTNFTYTTRIQKATTLEIRVDFDGKSQSFTRVLLPAQPAEALIVSFK